MVRTLFVKLGRDLVGQWAQVLTMAALIACGVGAYVGIRGSWKSLERSATVYHEDWRFGDVFVHLSAAPDALEGRIAGLPGVAIAEGRLVEPVRALLPGRADPARGAAISLPAHGRPALDDVWLRQGRWPEPGRDEALVLRGFALAHDLGPGDVLEVVLAGHAVPVRISGLVESPEFLMAVAPGEQLPDAARLVVVWMLEPELAPLVGKEGAFDDVVLRLQPGASTDDVLDALDALLAPYGGTGAFPRADQPSARFLEQELLQLRLLATTIPIVFLAVGAFLLQVSLGRTIELQRTTLATLKAFGYTRAEIATHYLGFGLATAGLGAAAGVGLGVWVGRGVTALYADFFHLPAFSFALDAELVLTAVSASLLAALLGGLRPVLSVAALPPAEAMLPPAPPTYHRDLLDRLGMYALLPPALRMLARDLARRPARIVATVVGIAAAAGVVVLGRFSGDAIGEFEDLLFGHLRLEDVEVVFTGAVPAGDARALAALPAVARVELGRLGEARVRRGHRVEDAVIVGHEPEGTLRPLLDLDLRAHAVPERGALLTDALATKLAVEPGDAIDLELLTDGHATGSLVVADVLSEPLGMQVHVSLPTYARLLRQAETANVAYLEAVDGREEEVVRALGDVPGVLGATRRSLVRGQFDAQTGETRSLFRLIATAFGAVMAVGVVYNNARVTLSARARELASLRVLGFTAGEVTAIVLAEQGLQLLLGIPLGLVWGRWMAGVFLSTADPDTWRFPIVIHPSTYAFATLVVLGAAAASAWRVRRQVDALDLVAVLKTRE